jgi:hypothetical protein
MSDWWHDRERKPEASTKHPIVALELLLAVLHIFEMETLLFSQLYQQENTQSWHLRGRVKPNFRQKDER